MCLCVFPHSIFKVHLPVVMVSSSSAFLQPLCVPKARAARIGRSTAVCQAAPSERAPSAKDDSETCNTARIRFLPRIVRSARLSRVVVATFGTFLGAVLGVRTVPTRLFIQAADASQQTTSKQLRYDGRQELDSREKAMSLTLTAGTFAALGVWAWKQNRRDDELENVRIKEEVERLEKLRAEFMDVEDDDESLDDEDLLASLKQRLSEGDDADGDDTKNADNDKDANGTDEENTTTEGENTSDVASSDSRDMLRRMWEATDDDSKKDSS